MTRDHPIITSAEPIPGTHLYRRTQAGHEIAPVYVGDATDERQAQEEADSAGLASVVFLGRWYGKVGGDWYWLNFGSIEVREERG